MLFRKQAAVQGLHAPSEDAWQVSLGGEHNITVCFREDSYLAEDPSIGYEEEIYYLEVTTEGDWQLDEQTIEWFGSFRPDSTPRLKDLPENVRAALRLIEGELSREGRRVTNVLRWRFGVRGYHEPVTASNLEWMDDEGVWRRTFVDRSLTIWPEPTADFSDGVTTELMPLVTSSWREPLGHSLIREAWDQRSSNPRSALVIGVAAAEVGFKQFVAEMAPQAAWLIEEVPSPPLQKLLLKYLPILLQDRNDLKVKAIPRQVVDSIYTAVEQRNTIVHKSPTASDRHENAQTWLTDGRLQEALWAVADLLWLLDYYRGRTWAIQHLRKETWQAWKALEEPH